MGSGAFLSPVCPDLSGKVQPRPNTQEGVIPAACPDGSGQTGLRKAPLRFARSALVEKLERRGNRLSLLWEVLSRRNCGQRGLKTMKSARFIRSFLFVLLLLLFGTWVLFRYSQNAILSGEPFTVGKAMSSNPAAFGKARTAANDDEADASPKTALAKSSSVTGEAARDQLRKSGQYESLAAAFHAARYAVEKLDPLGPNARGADYFAANPAQQLRAWFRPDGIELASGRPTREGVEPWSVEVRLRAVGRTGALAETGPRTIRVEGSRVEMSDRDGVITEWFENKREGIEQGFTIAQPPPGAGALELVLGVAGNVRATSDGARFSDADGADVVSVTDLKVWDADGRVLAARMEVRGSELALLVADAGARYPVTIDPIFANLEARLGGGDVGRERVWLLCGD